MSETINPFVESREQAEDRRLWELWKPHLDEIIERFKNDLASAAED